MISKTVIKAKSMFHSQTAQGRLIHVEIFCFRKKITSRDADGGSIFLCVSSVNLHRIHAIQS